MRLICPNCGAQYEVPTEVIPESGRDVQCSNCGNTWFQKHPDHDPANDPEPLQVSPEEDGAPEDAPAADIPKRELDAAVAEVLREEREREARLRAAEGRDTPAQPPAPSPVEAAKADAAAERRAREASERMDRLRGLTAGAEPDSPRKEVTEAPESRRRLLPDIEDIDSEIESNSDRHAAKAAGAVPVPRPRARRRSGFRIGFGLTTLVAALFIFAYVYAAQLIASFPAAEPLVTDYVTRVNETRVLLDAKMTEWMLWLDEVAASAGGNVDRAPGADGTGPAPGSDASN